MRHFPLVVLFCLVHFFHFTFQIDSSSFLIYNVDHNKCVVALSANSIQAVACNPSNNAQRFRWTSGSRLLSISQKLCLGAQSVKDWVKVLLYPCDEKSNLQQWECKNETLFGLVGADLHFNYGNFNEKNMMIYKGSGSWSRWQIYGTQENLCSRGYEEIFSIGGNGLGSPCQFPFRFEQKWYAECTLAGRSDGLLWCSMVTDYDKEKKWGFCPTKSNDGWDSDPVTGILYQRNTQATLTWHQARKSCQQQGADLLSVVELHEQTYIAGLTNTLGSSLWIGLNSLDFDSGWQWSNGNPFRYLNWAPGHPSSVPGMNCAALNSGKASKWESISCSQKLGYICRKGNSTSLTPLPSVMDQPGFCPSHWVPYAGRCYYIQRTKKMWKDALAECHKEGGDLASLHNIEEHSFVISQLGYLESDELWIGLNDQRTPMLFEWSDRSHVTFTNWKVGEPSHGVSMQEDCVLIKGKDGKWADHVCEKEFGYICKKKASTKQTGTSVTVAEGCKPGWTRFGSYCYYASSEKKTFDEAKEMCQSSNSYLIDVINRYENAYLVSLVGLRPEKYFWIGLSNTADRHTFVWTNTKNVKFTHFNVGMPDRNQGCVAMTTGMLAGLWDVISCSTQQKYICKHLAEGIISTVAPPTTPPLTCPLQWRSLGTRNYCYKSLNGRDFLSALKVYNKNMKQKKTWFESRDFCQAIGGELLSIHSSSEFDGNIMGPMSENAWIGINALNANSGYTWSDGSVVSYENWGYGEPNNYNDAELCGEVSFYYGKPWNDRHCEAYNNWICQIRKGVTPKPEPTNTVPEYNVTKDGWIEYNNTQYYINKQKLAVDDARAYCKRNFGDLVVITGETERKFLWKQISRENEDQYYIGLTVDLDKTFQWVDGSPVSYVAWENNEPNFANNDENCVTMYKNMGFWNDINCGVTLPSICKRNMGVPVNATAAPTEAPKGGCPPDWNFFQGKCYKFLGESQSDLKSWQDARSYCINLGGNLVSILNEKEQAYLTITRAGIASDAWIGLNDVNWEMRFLWTDGRGVYYTNWAKGQPVSVPERSYMFVDDEEYDCVVMVGGSSLLAGFWKVEGCSAKRGFICKRNIDPQINIPATTALPKTYQKLGNDSYKVVAQEMNWDESRRQCKADDADLASILDPIAQAYVSMFLYQHKKSMWIGLNTNETDGYFRWTDNWRMRYTNWAPGEPRNNVGCVYIDVDGKWKTASCSESHYSLCKHSPEIAPTDAPQLPGICPEPKRRRTWVPFRGHCYAFMLMMENWAHASIDCTRMGGTLLSIEDPVEAKFIKENLDILQDGSKAFWIGLYKTHRGDWLWIDNSVVDYSDWLVGEPSATNEECVEILSDTGKWNNNNCNRYKSYICKMAKVIPPTQKLQTVIQPEEPPQSFAGVAIAMVIVILTLVGVAGYFLYKRRPVLQECTFDNTLYFNTDPSRSTSIDTKGLVDNIEQNERAITI